MAGEADRRLDVTWVDVEGGAATLIVTPAGESVLVDAGNPGPRDAQRIFAAAIAAGVKQIDHLVVTHFHSDHYGGVAELAKLLPIATLYDHDVATAPDNERTDKLVAGYKAAKVGKRVVIRPGATITLRSAKGAAPTLFQFLGAAQKFVAPKGKANTAACKEIIQQDPDASDNANSAVMLLSHGPFRFFDAGDLTWNIEGQLVCPKDRVGEVDVYQSTHHGLGLSNNPVVVRTLKPTVAVVNNGARKGGDASTFTTLRSQPTIRAVYQLHRNVREDGKDANGADEFIANQDEACAGHVVKLSVDPQGKSFVMSVPATKHEKVYETKKK
jgi:beta-lactamase superfamily II metal-dependent hydrolase